MSKSEWEECEHLFDLLILETMLRNFPATLTNLQTKNSPQILWKNSHTWGSSDYDFAYCTVWVTVQMIPNLIDKTFLVVTILTGQSLVLQYCRGFVFSRMAAWWSADIVDILLEKGDGRSFCKHSDMLTDSKSVLRICQKGKKSIYSLFEVKSY